MSTTFPSTVAVAIPAYKAEKELKQFLPELLKFVPAHQITVMLDGIFDDAESVCRDLGVAVISSQENRGKGAALESLFAHLHSSFEWIVTMDADGQHAPEELVRFTDAIEKCSESDAIILGSRPRSRSSMPLLRRFSNGSTSGFLSLVLGRKIEDSQCGYRAYHAARTQQLKCTTTRFEMESEIIIRAAKSGYTIQNVPITTRYNGEESHISHVKDTLRWIHAVFSTLITTTKQKGSR